MLNNEALIARIKIVMEQQELNASAFAEVIGVQRSSISHILSGRNKPSLEFLAKIEAAFEEVNFEWLLKGNENSAARIDQTPTLPEISPGNETTQTTIQTTIAPQKDTIVKIVHYYADGSFESFFKR